MRKETASRTWKHPPASTNQRSGLMVKGEKPRPSAWEESALDHRSHRTVRRHSLRTVIRDLRMSLLLTNLNS